MGSCQLLTLRSLAQVPRGPPAGSGAANRWRTVRGPRRAERGGGALHLHARRAESEAAPRGPALVSVGLSRSPFSPAPATSPPRLPGSARGASVTDSLASPEGGLASPRQRAPSICRKTPPFSVPLEHLQASASCPTPSLSMKNRARDRRGAEPHAQPAPRPGVTPTERGTAAAAQAPRGPGPAQGRAWPGGGPGRGAGEGARHRPRSGRTDSWRGRRSWGRRREGFIGVTFQKNSQRVAGVTPRGEKKFSYHVELEDSQSIFQTGSAFPVPV